MGQRHALRHTGGAAGVLNLHHVMRAHRGLPPGQFGAERGLTVLQGLESIAADLDDMAQQR